jgi:Alkylmercury lyase
MIDARDLELRNATYARFVELGRAPEPDELGAPADIVAGWRRLHDARALVLDGGAIRMANPFSAVPTPFLVEAAGRTWYANCAWDAFGICAALHADGRIEAACADCGERLVIHVRDRQPDDTSLLFHCLVPASHWWDDIVYT